MKWEHGDVEYARRVPAGLVTGRTTHAKGFVVRLGDVTFSFSKWEMVVFCGKKNGGEGEGGVPKWIVPYRTFL